MWQDPALMIVGFIFTIMLIPQLLDGILNRAILNFWTCLVTGLGCIAIGFVDITLGLPLAAAVSFTTGGMWLALLYYSEENRKKNNEDHRKMMKMYDTSENYVNPVARNLPIRDQGERNTSASMAGACALDLMEGSDE